MADRQSTRNGNLSIPLPFEEAIKAATEVRQPERKSRKKKSPKKVR